MGIELVEPLARTAAGAADERGLSNVRFAAGDAVKWLYYRFDAGSVDELHVYHPQPYYDPVEVSLGMLTAPFFERAWEVLKPDGLLVLQTDHRPFGNYLLDAARRHFDPAVLDEPWPDAPLGRTRREIVSRRKGLPIVRVVARRRAAPTAAPMPAPYFDPGRPGLRWRRVRRKRPRGPAVSVRKTPVL